MPERIINYIKRKRLIKWLLEIAFIVVVIFAVRAWQLKDVVEGEAPIINGQLITGETISLEQYKGKPVLVYFWATWCPVCKLVNGNIDAIAKDYQVLSVVSWSEDSDTVKQYLREKNITMPVLIDENGEWAFDYGVKGVPASFVINKEGTIEFIESGYTSELGLRLRLWLLEN